MCNVISVFPCVFGQRDLGLEMETPSVCQNCQRDTGGHEDECKLHLVSQHYFMPFLFLYRLFIRHD